MSRALITRILLVGLAMLPAMDPVAVPAAPEQHEAAAESADAVRREHLKSLEAVDVDIEAAKERERAIRLEIEKYDQDRAKLNEALILAAERQKDAEDAITASESRLHELEKREADLRNSLDRRKKHLAVLLSAMQRLGRSPPPALIASPGDAVQSVRSAILLGAVFPEVREEADKLSADLSSLRSTRTKIVSERQIMVSRIARYAEERTRTRILLEERQKLRKVSVEALEKERAKAAELAKKSLNLKGLIESLEREIESARNAAEAAKVVEAARKESEAVKKRSDEVEAEAKKAAEGGKATLASLGDPGRIAPLIPFSSAKGLLRRPARGVVVGAFNSDDGYGSKARGISIATRAGARITAPSDGWIVYAGPFRSYGQLLILNVGEGYHILLAGMDRIDVELGQFVLTGEPVAEMGRRLIASTAPSDIRSSQPVLYVEFRKNGVAIDPAPWWIDVSDKKVRG